MQLQFLHGSQKGAKILLNNKQIIKIICNLKINFIWFIIIIVIIIILADVYSFAIISQEIILRQGPFYLGEEINLSARG